MTDTCGHEMGGIWLPNRGGGSDYKPLYCNKPKRHEENYNLADAGAHAYLDPKSGFLVQRVLGARVKVDAKGCIRAPR